MVKLGGRAGCWLQKDRLGYVFDLEELCLPKARLGCFVGIQESEGLSPPPLERLSHL